MRALIISLLFSAAVVKADFNTALDAYEQENYQAAYEEFYELATLGEKRSQFNLGVMYYQGQFVERDLNKAYAWIKLSLDGELANEQQQRIYNIVSEKADLSQAESEYEKLAQQYSTPVILKRFFPVLRPDRNGKQAEVLKIVEPKYPREAAMKGIGGYTRFRFDLDKKGMPRNISVIESFPEGVFEKESLKAIKKWKFKPSLDAAGNPVPQKNLRYTLEFKLVTNDSEKYDVFATLTDPSIEWQNKILPDIPKRQLRKDGNVELNVVFDIDKSGKATRIRLPQSDKKDYTDEIMDVIDEWKFKVIEPIKDVSATITFTYESISTLRPKPEYLEQFHTAALEGDAHGEFMYGLLLEKYPVLEDSKEPNEWYFSSAIKGHPSAQYLLGKNLITGKGCESDKTKGIEWLVRAAANGQLNAKLELGLIYANNSDLESHKAAKSFLGTAVERNLSELAKLKLAWLLIESPYDEVRDTKKGLALAQEINWNDIGDSITKYELQAAAIAATGNYKKALEFQEEALEQAEDGGFDTSVILERLATYQGQLNKR